jgi:hypothetical protein
MDKKHIRIVSPDGRAISTEIFAGDQQLKGVTKIEFNPLEAGGFVTARITAIVELDLIAELTGVVPEKFAKSSATARKIIPDVKGRIVARAPICAVFDTNGYGELRPVEYRQNPIDAIEVMLAHATCGQVYVEIEE